MRCLPVEHGAAVTQLRTRRPSDICEMPRYHAVFCGLPMLGGGDRTGWLGWEDSNSEMSAQNIPLKGFSGDPAEFWPQRLFAFELRLPTPQLGPSARISAGCRGQALNFAQSC